MPYLLFLTLLLVTAPPAVLAAEYPCPSDPGFCYRDLGDDGCFDSGSDIGPINAMIEASGMEQPASPGSIVCPPSVKDLSPTSPDPDIRLSTPPGSDVLFYEARIRGVEWFTVDSGGRVLLGGIIQGLANQGMSIDAAGDISVDKGALFSVGGNAGITIKSTGGDISLGKKAKLRATGVSITADIGSISFDEGVNIKTKSLGSTADIEVVAAGVLEMVRPKLSSDAPGLGRLTLEGASVAIQDKARLVAKAGTVGNSFLRITATTGDVQIDRLIATSEGSVEISGTNVRIGLVGDRGSVRPSALSLREPSASIDIDATGTTSIDALRMTTAGNATVVALGTSVNFLRAKVKGIKGTPTLSISAGPGSTCDLTGTTVKGATLVTSCDTVVGP